MVNTHLLSRWLKSSRLNSRLSWEWYMVSTSWEQHKPWAYFLQHMTPLHFHGQRCTKTLKSTHSDKGTVPQLLPTALPPCSWCHYSHTEQRRSLRSLLRDAGGRHREKNGKGKKREFEMMGTAASFTNKPRERAGKCTQIHLSQLSIIDLCDRAV